MYSLRQLGIVAFALAVVVGVSACQKKQTETSSSTTDTTMSAESPYPVEETPPAAQTTPPAENPPATSGGSKSTTTHTTKGTKGSSSSSTASTKTTVSIPSGTTMDLVMVSDQSTKTSNIGDAIQAKLASPLVVGGKVVANEGALVSGKISDLKRASHAKDAEGRAFLKFDFNSIETVDGSKSLNATVTSSEGKELEAKSTSTRDKLLIGGGTVAGAVIGKVAGGSTKSTIIGAIGGAAVGAGVVAASKGHELEVPAGAQVVLKTEDPITVVMAK